MIAKIVAILAIIGFANAGYLGGLGYSGYSGLGYSNLGYSRLGYSGLGYGGYGGYGSGLAYSAPIVKSVIPSVSYAPAISHVSSYQVNAPLSYGLGYGYGSKHLW